MEHANTDIQKWKELFRVESAINYKAGTRLFCQGSSASDVYVIDHGLIKLNYDLPDGGRTILALRLPGQYIGHLGYSSQALYSFSAVAATDSALLRIRAEEVRSAINNNHVAAQFIVTMLEDDLDQITIDLCDQKTLATSQIFERMLRRFSSSRRFGDYPRDLSGRIPLSDTEIAEFLGVSAEHFSRVKRRLIQEKRLIARKGTLTLAAARSNSSD
jgi:CRP-like cAMP-binding protein